MRQKSGMLSKAIYTSVGVGTDLHIRWGGAEVFDCSTSLNKASHRGPTQPLPTQ